MIIEILYEIFYILPMTVFGIKLAGLYFFEVPEKALPYIFGMAIAVFCSVFFHLDKNKQILLASILLILCSASFAIVVKKNLLSYLYEHMWILLVAGFSIAVYIVMKLILLSDKFKVLLALSIIGYLIYSMIWFIDISEVFIGLALLEVILIVLDEIQKYWKKEGYYDKKNHLVFTLPFVFIICLFVFLIPSPKYPYSWNFVKNFWDKASIYTLSITEKLFHSNEEDFGEAEVGFSEKGRLTAVATNDKKSIMRLKVNRKEGSRVYLSGKIFDRFENNEWKSTYFSDDKSRIIDTLETLTAAMIYSNDVIPDYMLCDYYTITYLPFTTRYVFTPPKTINFIYNESKMNIENVGEMYYFDTPMGIDTDYQAKAYRLNMGNECFKDFVNSKTVINRESWEAVCKRYSLYDDNAVNNLECLEDYRKKIYKYYLPKTEISDEMQEYIDIVTKNADNDYEKLLCIEKALSQNTYNLNVTQIPDSVKTPSEFLDYFVLNSKEGFCMHYATSFVIMARAMGYPARFVQGYYAVLDNKGACDIDSTMSHAWPEVYFEGIGWISFEPTPGYKRVSKWTTKSESQKYRDELKSAEELDEQFDDVEVPDIEIPDIEVQIPQDESLDIEWYYIVVPIAGCIVFFLIFMIFDIIILRGKVNGKNNIDKIKGLCRWNMNILRVIGVDINEGETLEEYAERIIKFLPDEAVLFISCYETVSYSTKEIEKEKQKEMLSSTENSNKILLAEMKSKSSILFIINYFKSLQNNK